jgi:hypothetical protein
MTPSSESGVFFPSGEQVVIDSERLEFGWHGMRRNSLGMSVIPVQSELSLPPWFDLRANIGHAGGPFGEVAIGVVVDSLATVRVSAGPLGDPDVAVWGDFIDLVEWVHGEAILGDLVHRGLRVRGDLWALSALDAVIEQIPRDVETLEVMRTIARR